MATEVQSYGILSKAITRQSQELSPKQTYKKTWKSNPETWPHQSSLISTVQTIWKMFKKKFQLSGAGSAIMRSKTNHPDRSQAMTSENQNVYILYKPSETKGTEWIPSGKA